MSDELLQCALFYKSLGFDIIPDHPTEKYPKGFNSWEKREFTEAELRQKIGKEGWGIGIRNQEGLDFDDKGSPPAAELLNRWKELVEAQHPGLIDRLTIEKTKNNGYHAAYKCSVIEGNQTLATRPPTPAELAADPKKKEVTLIETRGTGGQFMVAPSPGYKVIQGGWANLREITPEERDILLSSARALDAPKPEPKRENGKTPEIEGARPGDIYKQQHTGEALELLQRSGWVTVYSKGETTYLRRPGKNQGISATFNYQGSNVLYCFSSNASPFEMRQSYNPFAIYTTLEHDGDFAAAAKNLATRFGLNGNHNGTLNPVVRSEPNSEQQDFTFKRYSVFEYLQRPKKVWLVKDLIGEKDLAMLFGDAGTGKTFVALNLAFCAALGLPFAGKFAIDRPLKVAFCAGEGHGGLTNRLAAAINAWKGYTPDRAALLAENLSIFDNVPQLYDQEAEQTIYKFVNDWQRQNGGPLDLLIVDTLHNATYGADENNAKDAGVIIQAARYGIETLGCAVFPVHHANRAGKYRGSSAFHGGMDTMVEVRYDKDIKIGTVEAFKIKDADAQPLYFKLAFDSVAESCSVEWQERETISLDRPKKSDVARDAILELLRANVSLNQTQIVNQLKDEVGRHTILTTLKELEESGLLVSSPGEKNGKIYQLRMDI